MRINVDDRWWSDPRREVLIQMIGDMADTVALRMWRAAQTYWGPGGKFGIPKKIYNKLLHAKEWMEVGLAIEKDGAVYIRGSSSRFGWLTQQVQHMGGVARSKKAERNQDGTFKKSGASSSRSSLPSPSPSPSPLKERKIRASPSASAPTQQAIAHFVDTYEAKHGTKPTLSGQDVGQMRRLVKQHPVEEVVSNITRFINADDKFFRKRGFTISCFVSSYDAIRLNQGGVKRYTR
jgi:hypothetical protein